MKKILVIKGHPRRNSFCNAIADYYINGVMKSGCEIRKINVSDNDFEKYLKNEHLKNNKLDNQIEEIQNLFKWADKLVFVYPIWWGTPPAILKLLIETIIVPGVAYRYKKSRFGFIPNWDKYFISKKAQLFVTMDSPVWYYKYFIGDPNYKMMKRSFLNFVGVKKIKIKYFGNVRFSSLKKREKWLKKVYLMGKRE